MSESISIRLRLILWYVFFLAASLIAYSIYLQVELQRALSVQVDSALAVAGSQLLVDVDDTVNPPALRPMSQSAVDNLARSLFALRMVTRAGEVTAQIGSFPTLTRVPTGGFDTLTADDGVRWRVYTQPVVTTAGEFDVLLQLAQSLTTVDDAHSSLTRLVVIGVPVVLVAAALVGVFIADRSLRPLTTMTRIAQQINGSDMTRRIDYVGPHDELSRLAATLNSMLTRLEAAFDNERRFTADASHELRTPLTAIKGQIGVTLSRLRTPDEYQTTLMHIQHETDRLIRLTHDLLFLARLDSPPPARDSEPLDLRDLIDAIVDQCLVVASDKGLVLRSALNAPIPVVGMPDHLIRLFLNLIDNAIKFTPAGGTITLTCDRADGEVRIAIADTGPGIAPEHVAKIFQRFYRVEADRSTRAGGMGLGLAIAWQIAREHGGRIDVTSTPGEGSTFTVCLPVG